MTAPDELIAFTRAQMLADRAAAETMHRDGCVWVVQRHYYPCDCGMPRDVIADCDAKLAMLDEYERIAKSFGAYTNQGNAGGFMAAQTMIRLLAQGYRHRDGWQEEWSV